MSVPKTLRTTNTAFAVEFDRSKREAFLIMKEPHRYLTLVVDTVHSRAGYPPVKETDPVALGIARL